MNRPEFLAKAAHTIGHHLRIQPPGRRRDDNYVTTYLKRHVHIGVVAAEGSDPEVRVHARTDNASLGQVWAMTRVPGLSYRTSGRTPRHYLECAWRQNTADYTKDVQRMNELVSFIVEASAAGRIP